MRLTCKSWSCRNCGREKINEISQRVADATIDIPIIHEIDARLEQLDTITAFIRKKKVSALNLKLSNRAYLLVSEPIKGRTWTSSAIARAAAIAKLHKIDTTTIRRRDYTLDWRPEPLYDPKKDTVIFTTSFSNAEDLNETLAMFDIDLKKDYVLGDPMHVMERIVKGRTDYTIVFEGKSYTT